MSAQTIFQMHLVLGYVAWLLAGQLGATYAIPVVYVPMRKAAVPSLR
jgi:hypothetical protein